jgi:molybdate transport system substrate-binding protein
MNALHVLSGGAANGLVSRVQPRFTALTGLAVEGTYSAVGQMKDALLAGQPCDLIILSEALIAELMAAGHLQPGSATRLGSVKTGVAVPQGMASPEVSHEAGLRQALQAAQAVYIPDPVKSTAGIHFMKVLKALGLEAELAPRLKAFANGQTAMAAMAADAAAGHTGLLGCTQVTEILNTAGVQLAGLLPASLELSTVYTAAVVQGSAQALAAAQLCSMLADQESAPVRAACGFS